MLDEIARERADRRGRARASAQRGGRGGDAQDPRAGRAARGRAEASRGLGAGARRPPRRSWPSCGARRIACGCSCRRRASAAPARAGARGDRGGADACRLCRRPPPPVVRRARARDQPVAATEWQLGAEVHGAAPGLAGRVICRFATTPSRSKCWAGACACRCASWRARRGRRRPSGARRSPSACRRVALATPRGDVPFQLDLRGLRRDEALERLEQYLEDASLAGLPEARIVHGKGTGAIRQAVRETLAPQPVRGALRARARRHRRRRRHPVWLRVSACLQSRPVGGRLLACRARRRGPSRESRCRIAVTS